VLRHATRIASRDPDWALVKPRAFALYLGFTITGAMIAGYAYAAVLALHL
jgi:hypothetical protein